MDVDDFGDLCMGCMKDKGNSACCPQCGYRPDPQRNVFALPYQTILNNKFLVGRILGHPGGFGITYLALDLVLHTPLAIKEYLPRGLAVRDTLNLKVVPHGGEDSERFSYGMGQFLQEARTLCKFSHPNVVRVREFFQQNNTAYLAMDYYEGISLTEYLGRNGGKLPEATALAFILPILDGLAEIHAKGFLHRDIKPANIYLTQGGSPILLDFGAARQALGGHGAQTLSVILTPGFAPFEQYLERAEFGPSTDIYAVGATLYYLLTGERPQEATHRCRRDEVLPPEQLESSITPAVGQAIMRALAIEPEQRPQTIQEFKALLLAGGAAAPAPRPTPPPPPERSTPGRLRLICRECGERNTVPTDISLSLLGCAGCGASLAPPSTRKRLPAWVWPALGAASGVGALVAVAGLAWFEPAGMEGSGGMAEAARQPSATPGPPQGLQSGSNPLYPPPQNAIDLCQGKALDAVCWIQPPDREAEPGRCRQVHAYFACVPDSFLGGAGGPIPP